MLPLMLDLRRLRLILVGDGAAALARLQRLEAAGAVELAVHAERPSGDLALAAGDRLVRRLPSAAELASAQLVFIADPVPASRGRIIAIARAVGTLLHIEDEPESSDAQAPAVLRRGALTIAVSTGGASPFLATQIRDVIGGLFGPEWRERLDELAALRRGWRAAGTAPLTVAQWTKDWIARRGWLPPHAMAAIARRAAAHGSTRVRPSDRVAAKQAQNAH